MGTLSTQLAWIGVVLALLALVVGFPRRKRRGNVLRAMVGLVVLAVAGTALLGALLLRQYHWVMDDVPVAHIALRELGPQSYEATFTPTGAEDPRVLPLHGDEWQLDARVIRWKLPALLAGVRPMVRLERLSGRYGDPKQELTAQRDVHDLRARWDFWTFRQQYLARLPIADARFGSATYLPMLDGARYDVFVNPRGGLIAKPADAATEDKLRAAGW
jgi:hypothetical protein